MRDLKYEVEFYSIWHCGSGLAGGASKDAIVIKDIHNLPYIPGKTIKGLVREALENVLSFSNKEDLYETLIQSLGNSKDHDLRSDVSDDSEATRKGTTFFTNAVLDEQEQACIISEKLSEYMYRSISSTAIGENGTAVEHSLRVIECTIPCKLYGEIQDIPDSIFEEYKMALQMIKRIGVNRNRGLGRCKFSIKD